ncbi:MAG TPA: 2-oxoacid:acceptor oxidoreductase subunit alpha [Alphaproteobacteria bacterium]|nr:2-oxoacid:acceptor oxidoreductase subunit alpha [Alphaproteobacteria bacterium]
MSADGDRTTSLSIVLAGSGGAGVITAGNMLIEAAVAAGWFGMMSRSSGPQIRGGEAASLIRLANQPVAAHPDCYDILIALDWQNVERFAAEIPLSPDSLVVGDEGAGEVPDFVSQSGARSAALPFKKGAKAIEGGRPNMIALGLVAALAGIPDEFVDGALTKVLGAKRPEAVAASRAAVAVGAAAARDLPAVKPLVPADKDEERWLISGNEAVGLGAIKGGVRFVAAYPITPATEILEWMAPALSRVGGTLVQAEDELASINMVIGASFGGTPALTATSGPGMALMTEPIGLAVAAEVPLVVVDVMRGGPSTGIPTKSEQSDLGMALHGLPGDAPHLVLAPNSVGDCLFTAQWAVHLAEAMQVPAIVLSDQSLGQARAAMAQPADIAFFAQRQKLQVGTIETEAYERYELTASGVSAMAIPGTPGGQYTADGLEHNSRGTPSSQNSDHYAQLDKRRHKLEAFEYGNHWAEIEGSGEIAVITWGSCTGPAREALALAAAEGLEARLLSIRLLAPARPEHLAAALDGVERALIVEQTHSGQFRQYLQANYALPPTLSHFCNPGPLPIRPGEIHHALRELSRS